MARIRKKVKRNIAIISLLLIILCSFVAYKFIFNETSNNANPNLIDKNKDKDKNKEPEDPIKTYTAKLIATGDGLIHSPLYKAAYNNGTYDFSSMLTYTKEKIKDYDIKYYNQETISDDTVQYSSYPVFNTPSQYGQNMIDIGFNLVSLASNHSMDKGVNSAKKSASWWRSKDHILATGMASSIEDRENFKIMEANGITYTMLSYTYGTNGIPVPNSDSYVVNVFNEEQAKKDIEKVRDKVDVLIVAMHWGNEYQQTATETQRNQAKFLADNGVDIILGNHSHCIEPWEWIDDTVVFYSFGNFISNKMGAEEARIRKVGVIGMFGTLDITKTVDTANNNATTIKIDNIGADLNYTYRFYNPAIAKNDYLVIPFSKMKEKYLKDYESVYNEFSNVLKSYDSSIKIEPLPTLPAN